MHTRRHEASRVRRQKEIERERRKRDGEIERERENKMINKKNMKREPEPYPRHKSRHNSSHNVFSPMSNGIGVLEGGCVVVRFSYRKPREPRKS